MCKKNEVELGNLLERGGCFLTTQSDLPLGYPLLFVLDNETENAVRF